MNKANRKDLIDANVILLKFDPNRQLLGRCDIETWQMTSKNNREPLPSPQNYVCDFIAIQSFELELPTGNAQIKAKSLDFRPIEKE